MDKDNSTRIPKSGVQLAVFILRKLRTRRKRRRGSCVLIDAAIEAADSGRLDSAMRSLERLKYCVPITGEDLALLEEAMKLFEMPIPQEKSSWSLKITNYLLNFAIGRALLNVWMMIQSNIQLSLISFSKQCTKYIHHLLYRTNAV